jgi:hypothetical protein
MEGSSPGSASLYGSNGTSMICELHNSNMSGHGAGSCKTSKGAVFRLQY